MNPCQGWSTAYCIHRAGYSPLSSIMNSWFSVGVFLVSTVVNTIKFSSLLTQYNITVQLSTPYKANLLLLAT